VRSVIQYIIKHRAWFFVLGGGFAIGLFFSSYLNVDSIDDRQALKRESLILRQDDHIYGDPNALIKIIEYAEVECQYCKQLHPVLIRIINENPGEVALVYRHYPLPVHPKSVTEALALECMAEFGGASLFWNFLGRLFYVTPSNNNIDLSILPSLAQEFGIEEMRFNECLQSDRHRARIRQDVESARVKNVSTVPHLFITHPSGEILEFKKVPSYRALTQSIEALKGISSRE